MSSNPPRCMSTQHPDNATLPFFTNNSVLNGDDEVQEAFYAYSDLGIREQLWDAEGKEIDSHVVKKLLTKYETFFRKHTLGKDVRLTLRIPNPAVEKNEAKIAAETLETIPRSFDVAKLFGSDVPPVFEVVLPMTSDAREVLRVHDYYTKIVVGKREQKINDVTIKEWIGDFKPDTINVVPLVEDKDSMLNVKNIVLPYLQKIKPEQQRVWIARSDPALNYGMLSAVLLNKIAMAELEELQAETSVEIFPIIGVGSVPFRGNFSPDNINCLKGYPSVQTFTVQSAFKYDYPAHHVRTAIEAINSTRRGKAIPVEKKKCLDIVERYSEQYTADLRRAMPALQMIVKHIPRRRARKLHIGLFGYSRGVGEFQLPRAISFCASLYSIGLPPELFGLSALTSKDFEYLDSEVYKNFDGDLRSALKFVNVDAIAVLAPELGATAGTMLKKFHVEVDAEHKKATDDVIRALKQDKHAGLHQAIVRAGTIRKFLG
ncbi:MAG TPA: phosphoenolpyruvate carboxylase [Candidatus Nanoarchaeia archaeon]|nr:phosphoenolpyruvate carboxylase [Candidatus Nanoarchaeia archaeon]